ncbi:MAG TPA: FxSxx-COOH system tetratricopeptide repeat protein [Ktedonosporobacter sp.]|jgi:tetratricopeptide (TPR) repeat protein|nr:FxSxx-COOH system tetratricopeptide repeat protein [Ktedonosporobacter sp.]
MEPVASPVDVCIVCALPEEVRPFLEVVQPYCEGKIEEQSSSRYQYDHRLATIKNKKDERLRLHFSWLARYGPQEMTLHLSHVLEECQPRIAIMTGICAGDKVQLGDLVVAERTFTYDSGKFVLDEQGRQVHLHDTLTYQLDAAILQFLGLFDAWKPLLAALPRPPAPPDTTLEEREVRCFLKAMASGSAVRADQPFADVRVPVRGTAAIDMEGAAFALAASRHHHTPWLVVKGVCDYADNHKGDAYHDFAARASALYALSFIQHYVTHERPPRRDNSSSSGGTSPDHPWRVPHTRNPHFTGRDAILTSLRQMLVPGAKVTALTQAISGLGGIGKTQVAVEYAHRYADAYKAVLWAQADSSELLTTEYLALATVLGLPEQQEAAKQVEAVKHWLQTHREWLLILDNVEEPRAILPTFLPSKHEGSVLITTRRRDVSALAHSEVLPVFGEAEGVLFLLRRAGRIAQEARITDAAASDYHRAKDLCELLGWLPLALDQAGAYIAENGVSFERYLELYRQSQQKLLDRRGDADHPDSVFMTFWLSWDAIQQRNKLAGTILQFCAFLAPDQIPESLVQQAMAHTETTDPPEPIVIDEALGLLYRYSLIERANETLSLHRLIQDVIRALLSEEERQQWMERAVLEVNAIFPDGAYETWPQCEFLLPHALTCAEWVKGLRRAWWEGGRLCNNAGRYLCERGLYEAAESLLQQALSIAEQQLGPTHPNAAASLSNLAEFYKAQGKYEQAEPLLQRALSIRVQQLGSTHPETAISLNNLAGVYYARSKYEQAEPLYQRALSIAEQQLGPAHPQTAGGLNNLAMLYTTQGKYEQAEPLLQRALSIAEQQLGSTHPNTAISLNNLAQLYHVQGKYEQAEPLYQRALSIREQQLGPTHLDVAASLNNLALLYHDQDKDEQAEPLLRRIVGICAASLGVAHPQTQRFMRNYALIKKEMGGDPEALP